MSPMRAPAVVGRPDLPARVRIWLNRAAVQQVLGECAVTSKASRLTEVAARA